MNLLRIIILFFINANGAGTTTVAFTNYIKEDKNYFYTATLTEHAPVGTVIARLKTTDNSSGGATNFIYTLQDDNFPVYLDKDGVIRVKDQLLFDREKYPKGINLTVEKVMTENSTENITVAVHLTLEDINDNTPFFICTYPFTVRNTTMDAVIGQVAALDFDEPGPNSNLTYDFVDFGFSFSDCPGNVRKEEFPIRLEATGEVRISSSSFNCLNYRSVVRACDNPVFGDRRCDIAPASFSFPQTNLPDRNQIQPGQEAQTTEHGFLRLNRTLQISSGDSDLEKDFEVKVQLIAVAVMSAASFGGTMVTSILIWKRFKRHNRPCNNKKELSSEDESSDWKAQSISQKPNGHIYSTVCENGWNDKSQLDRQLCHKL